MEQSKVNWLNFLFSQEDRTVLSVLPDFKIRAYMPEFVQGGTDRLNRKGRLV